MNVALQKIAAQKLLPQLFGAPAPLDARPHFTATDAAMKPVS
jgi:hypothetical protein